MRRLGINTVRAIRSTLYFPVDLLPKLGFSYGLARWYLRQVVQVDAPLRRYLLGGRHEV